GGRVGWGLVGGGGAGERRGGAKKTQGDNPRPRQGPTPRLVDAAEQRGRRDLHAPPAGTWACWTTGPVISEAPSNSGSTASAIRSRVFWRRLAWICWNTCSWRDLTSLSAI